VINRVRRVAQEIIQFGRRRDPWAGFKVEDVAGLHLDFRAQLSVTVGAGCVAVNLLTSSPVYQAGLRLGDVILGINGQRVDVSVDLDFAFWSLFVGDPVTLEIDRGGQRSQIHFRIEELTQ